MVDFTSLNTSTLETATRFHDFAKNIETAHLGNLYTTVIDGIDYYVVEGVAKPLLEKAPEWVYENSVIDSIKNHKGLYILAAGIITLIFINYMLHAKDEVKGPGLKPTSPDSKDENDPNLKNGDGKDKPTGPNLSTTTKSKSKDDPNLENGDGIDKTKDNILLNTNDEEGALVEDSDNEKIVKSKDSGEKLKNTVNKNGDNVDDVKAGEKNDANNSNNEVHTLLVKEEIDLESTEKKNGLEDPLKTKTDAENKGSASDLEEESQ